MMLLVCGCGEWHAAQAAPHMQAQTVAAQSVSGTETPSLAMQAWQWILAAQAALNRRLMETVHVIKEENWLSSTMTLVLIAFGYGVAHAAGPGHGKAVISSYVLTNEETLRRGVALSFLAAIFQALSAILIVGVLLVALRVAPLSLRVTEARLETLSWLLIAGVGVWMLWRQLGFSAANKPMGGDVPAESRRALASRHVHGPDCGCGHAHMPNPHHVPETWSWRKAMPIALAIGIRPCTGALLLLIFSVGQGLFWAGVLGTLAMAAGTALTVSGLATFAISSRHWAVRLSGPERPWGGRLTQSIGVVAALL
jgi:nickel/cobalt transporter (NicO) family protein